MRKRNFIYILVFILVLSAFIYVISIQEKVKNQTQKIKVAATIFPLYDITKSISAGKVDVELILPLGASPHTFDLSPKDVQKIQDAKMVFTIGHGLDDWILPFIQGSYKSAVVVVDKNIPLKKLVEVNEDNNNLVFKKDATDPHYWLSLENAKLIAVTIANSLSKIDPANSQTYKQNLDFFLYADDQLKNELQNRVDKISNRNIATFHNAWFYFTQSFGLKIATVFEEFPGKEPSPKYLLEFQKKIKENNIKVIFSEPQFSNTALSAFANDLGVKIDILDPIGGIESRDSYFNLIQFNINQIVKYSQ